MQTDEQDILDYLKAWPGAFVSGKEIARKVGGKKRFEEDHGWALPILAQMVRHKLVESDHHGGFRIQPPEKKKKEQHVSPQLLKILKSSGKNFDNVIPEDGNDEPPIPAYRKPDASPATADGNNS
jgi:hypothetical protein